MFTLAQQNNIDRVVWFIVVENQGSEFHDKIKAAFELFDNEGNKMIEQR